MSLKPIFHWKWGSRWVPNANEIYTKNMKCTGPTPVFCVGTQRSLYSTEWRRGLASGKTQILALGNAKIYQHVGISNAKFWCRGHCPTPTPDARYFASQWNIGFSPPCPMLLLSHSSVACRFFLKMAHVVSSTSISMSLQAPCRMSIKKNTPVSVSILGSRAISLAKGCFFSLVLSIGEFH